jgi:UDP-glucose 4-epimerase
MINLSGAKILIVGGAGFVGSNLAHHLLEKHNPKELLIVDNLLSADVGNVPDDSKLRFIYGSITEDNILHALPEDLDFVFHLACYHGNQSSIADPLADHNNNTLTSLKLFDRLKSFKGLKKVIYAGAGCAVAEKTNYDATPTREDAQVSMFHDSPYSISKIVGEMYGNYFFHQDGLPFVTARFQNVYGPREILGAGRWRGTPHTVWRNVIPTFIWKSIHGEALPLENAGISSRDFIFVEDVVRGLVASALKGTPGDSYNLASGIETTIADLAQLINLCTGNSTPVKILPARDWDRSVKRFGSTDKSRNKLQFEANLAIEHGIRLTVDWTLANMSQIKRAIASHNLPMRQLLRLN